MKMISITIYKAEIIEVKSIPFDNRLFDEHRVKSYPWLSAGFTNQKIAYVADHYTDNTVDILFKTENIVPALLGAIDVYEAVMKDSTSQLSTIKNL